MIRFALKSLAGRKLRTVAHRARDRPRRRDDERRLRPHRHDRQGVRLDLRRLVRRHGRRRDRQGSRLRLRGRVGPAAARSRRRRSSASARSTASRSRRARFRTSRRSCCGPTARRSTPAARRRSPSASRPRPSTTASTRSTSSRAAGPSGGSEVAIDEGVADDEDLELGDRIGVAALGPAAAVRDRRHRQVRRPELDRRRHLRDLRRPDGAAAAGQGRAARRGPGRRRGGHDARAAHASGSRRSSAARSRCGRASSRPTRQSSEIATFTTIIRYFLLSFAGIALFVGAFVIFNTLSITVAQRMREFATLRTLGASRRQVLRSVILEALVIGLGASLVGLFSGLGLAVGLNALFKSLNLDLPQTETVFATRTIVVSLLVGTLVTLIAGLFPAIRATRVPPIAAVREGATLPRGRFARFTPYIACVVVGAGGARARLRDARRRASRIGDRFALLGVGVLALFIGVAMLSSRLVRPLVRVVGIPARRFGGAAGQARRGQRAAQPGPHGRDRGGADDRNRARDVRLRPRQRPARLEQRRDRAPDPVRPDRHVTGRLLRVPGRRRATPSPRSTGSRR